MNLSVNVYNNLIIFFCLFALGGISGLFCEKVGIVNIGINGMMVIGAATYLSFADIMSKVYPGGANNVPGGFIILGTIVAMLFAALFALLHGYATIKLKSEHTISGFAINLLAFGLAILLLEIFGNGSKRPANTIAQLQYNLNVGATVPLDLISFKLVVTLLVIAIGAFALYKTRWGLRYRSVGENPQAADVAGINVYSIKWQGILISGAIAGIAGAIFAQNLGSSFNGDVRGYGYLALAIMIMGQWNIFIVSGISLIFSFLYALSFSSGTWIPELRQYSGMLTITPYVLSLIVIMLTARKSHAPAASGKVYDKSIR
ncbi:ABC transporter permease [Mycoplasmopsis mucosicanis]|uniref:ABC transporter permease n=1 Tax=Mycoplasmopsis mucosicanis TaxID=458208 RepID=A0A507SYP4_9BACT|nr:ABC transporter permease [Mycoplasmopsis mucosicanis]